MKKWLRKVKPKSSVSVVNYGEYESGMKMNHPHRATKVDFLPSGILNELKRGK